MIRKFKELLTNVQNRPMKEQKEILKTTLEDWMSGVDQVDDILVMGIRI